MASTRFLLILMVAFTVACAGTLSTDRQYDDAVIAERVREAMRNDADLAGYEIGVTVREGLVTLTGVVGSGSDAAKAGRIAETVVQVGGVNNLITVGGMLGVVK